MQQTVFNLCEYQKFTLYFYLSEGGDKAFEFYIDRSPGESHRDKIDVYFCTHTTIASCFTIQDVGLPLSENPRQLNENVTLSGQNQKIILIGKDAVPLCALKWDIAGDSFEGSFDVYNEKGDVIQSLALWE